MSSLLNIPFLTPIKFYPNTISPGINFDDSWMTERIKSFERRVDYYQKWQVGDSTPVQVESSIMPDDLKIYDCAGLVLSIPFTLTAPGGTLGINIYEAVVNLDTLPVNKVYYAYIKAAFMSVTFEAISEPILLQTSWPGTLQFNYYHSVNAYGVVFITGIQFSFRCEAGIMDMQPEYEGTDYIDQIHNLEILYGNPYRTYKLYIGDEKGVAPWVLDLLNRISQCDTVIIKKEVTEIGLEYARNTGSKWEVNRVKGYPLWGGALEIVESKNKSGLQFFDPADFIPPMVFAYDIDTHFFGQTPGTDHILDITQT